jgi:small subunit ribosomal protein S9
VLNASRIAVTRDKLETKLYARHSGYPHGLKEETLGHLLARRPEEVIRRAVKGMLPHNRLGAQQLRKLKVYAGLTTRTRPSGPSRSPDEEPTDDVHPAFFSGTGRRKTAVARVRLLPGEGEIVVNGRSLEEHFGNAINEADVRMPFRVTGTEGRYNAMIKVEGGGVTGQAGAIRHGIARALLAGRSRSEPPAAAPGRPPDPRPADEGAQEVRPQARPQGAAVHQALIGRRRCATVGRYPVR